MRHSLKCMHSAQNVDVLQVFDNIPFVRVCRKMVGKEEVGGCSIGCYLYFIVLPCVDTLYLFFLG